MNEKETLIEIRALIEKGWIKGAYARDGGGERVSPYSDSAVSFCLVGAMERSCETPSQLKNLYRTLGDHGMCSLTFFNDRPETTKADVLSLLDEAIQLCAADEIDVRNEALKLARGSYQRAIVLCESALSGADLTGAAARYGARYARSRTALIARIRAADLGEVYVGPHKRRILVLGRPGNRRAPEGFIPDPDYLATSK